MLNPKIWGELAQKATELEATALLENKEFGFLRALLKKYKLLIELEEGELLSDRITKLKESLENNESNIEDLENEVSNLQEEIDELEEQIEDLQDTQREIEETIERCERLNIE